VEKRDGIDGGDDVYRLTAANEDKCIKDNFYPDHIIYIFEVK